MAKRQSPKLEAVSSNLTAPAIIEDPTVPCSVCHPDQNGVETEMTRHWRSLLGGNDNISVFWLSVYGVWVCKTCHPPGHPDLVKREITIRGVAKREGSRFGAEECAGSNPAVPTNNADAGETVNPAGL
jgi:hypothetical protein